MKPKLLEDTINFSLELPLDFAQYSVLVPYPETEIYDYYRSNGLNDYWAEFTLDPELTYEVELVGAEVSRYEANQFLGQAYRRFYFRPKMFWRRVKDVDSIKEFTHFARGGLSLLTNSFKQMAPDASGLRSGD